MCVRVRTTTAAALAGVLYMPMCGCIVMNFLMAIELELWHMVTLTY